MINPGKAVEEVWEIRKAIGKDTKGMTLLEKAKKMHNHAKYTSNKLGLKVETFNKIYAS